MNKFAYKTTGLAIKALSALSKAKIKIHGRENIPTGSIVFVINHFTRIETFLIPYNIFKLTNIPVWSLASYELFKGPLGNILDKVGAVSTKDPDRDLLIVKSLLTGEASWIIFPEGRMVKNKKIIEKGQFMISYAGGKHPPHTGAATLALRTEFYRQRLKRMIHDNPAEAEHLKQLFQIDEIEPVLDGNTYIVPVNISYYPIRARENALTNLAEWLMEEVPDRMLDEIMTEGTMLLSGVDVDIRIGQPIEIKQSLNHPKIKRDIESVRKISFDDTLPSIKQMRYRALKIMENYMSAIYSMTTVNHDHIFASLLRMMPFRTIRRADFLRRAFLAALHIHENPEIHCHETLAKNQIQLLMEDRFKKFDDFLSIATERGIIKEKEEKLIKDPSMFSSPYDFHRARMDNPIEVMANDIEPLSNFQKHIRRIARKPSFLIKRKIVKYLTRKALIEFEEDYKKYYIEGESKDKNVGRPYLIKKRRKLGILLMHGYMAAPMEVKELAGFLSKKGLTVYCPRVKGHGTSPEDLAVRTYKEWINSIDEGFALLDNLCSEIVVGGFSNGAGLALDIASRMKNVKGVFAVCPPLRLQDLSTRFAPAVDVWNKLMNRVHLDDAKMEFVDNNPENPHINYLRNPISGVRELERMMNSIEPKLSNILMPSLIIQALEDPVVNAKGSKRIYSLLSSKNKIYMLFNYKRHGILLGKDAVQVHRSIWDFIVHL